MDFPDQVFLQPVKGDDDLFAFRFDFVPQGKALTDGDGRADVVSVQENGDLIIEGYAAVWDGDDREGENFAPGSFTKGVKAFLEGPASLCYHHKHAECLGKVLELQEEGKGLRMKARVDGAIAKHPVLGTYYEQIKSGTLKALSIGGFFKRGLVNGARKIIETDFTEISVTPVPVHTGPSFAVVAGKALQSMPDVPSEIVGDIRESDEAAINFMIDELSSVFDRIAQGVRNRKAN